MGLGEERQARLLQFAQSGQELTVGDQARWLSHSQKVCMTPTSPNVQDVCSQGLTAVVYKTEFEGQTYAIKRRRTQSLVKNVDGEVAFLNEIERRADFEKIKRDPALADKFSGVIDTVFASYLNGLIISPWLRGATVQDFNERKVRQVVRTLVECELQGIMEWDVSPGNIFDDGNQTTLFDFGYCYRFDPRQHFNSEGVQAPIFHAVERLETRSLVAQLLRIEATTGQSAALHFFRLMKILSIEAYEYKLRNLEAMRANIEVLAWKRDILRRWSRALQTSIQLSDLYCAEVFRSLVLDLDDDLHGKSCTPQTIQFGERILSMLVKDYSLLRQLEVLPPWLSQYSQSELISLFTDKLTTARSYQV